jgi:uncharacterized membrane protein
MPDAGQPSTPVYIEEFEDGRYTVFVPSISTPFAGAVYILDRQRVHPLDVPFTDALKVVSRWGSGAKDLVAAMEKGGKPVGGEIVARQRSGARTGPDSAAANRSDPVQRERDRVRRRVALA